MIFLTILFIPLIVSIGAFVISQTIKKKANINNDPYSYMRSFPVNEITGWELFIQFVIVFAITGFFALILSFQNLMHTEIWNGRVVSKERKKVSCRHSYECHCYEVCSGRGKSRRCHTECSTCYEHAYDIDWEIYDSTGASFDIETRDRQGLLMPDFWEKTQIGDPTAHKHLYKNYIKASAGSLFRKRGLLKKYEDVLPDYPSNIYDYYNLNRVVTVGVSLPDKAKWNKELSKVNAKVGKTKECNAIIVIVQNQPREYLYALEQHWLGGNKNDAILVISAQLDGTIAWAGVIALVENSMFKILVRDEVEEIGSIKHINRIIQNFYKNILVYYERKEMRKFEYLTATITPTIEQYIIVILINTIISILMSIYFHKEDVFKNLF